MSTFMVKFDIIELNMFGWHIYCNENHICSRCISFTILKFRRGINSMELRGEGCSNRLKRRLLIQGWVRTNTTEYHRSIYYYSRKHVTLIPCCFNVAPSSSMLALQNSIEFRVCWNLCISLWSTIIIAGEFNCTWNRWNYHFNVIKNYSFKWFTC